MLYSSPLWRGSLSWLTLPELWAADKENMLQWQLCHPARMKYAQFPSPRLALCLCLGQLFEICGEVLLLIQNFCWTFVTGVSRLWKGTRISLTCSLSYWEVPKILKQSNWLRSSPRQCASRHTISVEDPAHIEKEGSYLHLPPVPLVLKHFGSKSTSNLLIKS